jgi:hypothetical protein
MLGRHREQRTEKGERRKDSSESSCADSQSRRQKQEASETINQVKPALMLIIRPLQRFSFGVSVRLFNGKKKREEQNMRFAQFDFAREKRREKRKKHKKRLEEE